MVRTLLKEDIFKGDIDIFAHTEKALEKLITMFGKQKTWEKSKYAYSFEYVTGVRKTKVQIITKQEPTSANEIFDSFDLEHCKLGYNPCSASCYSSLAANVTLAQRKIRLSLVDDPTYTMMRVIKYKRMGFEADKALEQLAAMAAKKMSNVKFTDVSPVVTVEVIDAAIAEASS
jgi:hypothetical protein